MNNCQWLFTILFELEKGWSVSNYNQYESSIWIHSERLFNVWLEKQALNTKEIDVVF